MSCHSFLLIFEWAVQTCSTSYLLRSGSIAMPFFQSAWWSSEPGSGVKQKNSRRSIGNSSFMIAISRLIVSGASAGKPRIYPAMVRMPCFFQTSSILRYSVILFWRFCRRQIVRIDVLESDEHLGDASPFCLFHEIGNLVTKRVDLDHEAERNAVFFTKLDQAVKGRFPLFVACKVIVGDKKLSNALRPIEAHKMLYIVRRTIARLAALHVDDGAKR